MPIAFIVHMFYYTAVFHLMSRLAPYIPTAKAGGFPAEFGKKKREAGITRLLTLSSRYF